MILHILSWFLRRDRKRMVDEQNHRLRLIAAFGVYSGHVLRDEDHAMLKEVKVQVLMSLNDKASASFDDEAICISQLDDTSRAVCGPVDISVNGTSRHRNWFLAEISAKSLVTFMDILDYNPLGK